MFLKERHIDLMVFNYGTTALTDFRYGAIPPAVDTIMNKEKPPREKPPLTPIKDIHTMTDWQQTVPFDLMITPKPILQTNPHIIQKPYMQSEDLAAKEVRKTRPRLVMTPAVSMDDIMNERARDILIQDMYRSTMMIANKEGASRWGMDNLKAPRPGKPANARPLKLPPLLPSYVSPEWRMESVPWDSRQMRAYCDPTREFWLRQPPPKCDSCKETATRVAHGKMLRALKQNVAK